MADRKTVKKKKDEKEELNIITPEKDGGVENIIEELKDREKFINVPKTLLKKEEWGMLTVLNLLLAGIFPAYFVNILLISFFTEVGHLFTTHITEVERKRLMEFEKEFSAGYEFEKKEMWQDAVRVYESIIPKYKDNPKIAAIAIQRIDFVEKNSPRRET
jgi:hypothetical protein